MRWSLFDPWITIWIFCSGPSVSDLGHADMRVVWSLLFEDWLLESHLILFVRRPSESWFTTQPTWTPETRTGRRRCTSQQLTMLCAAPRWSSRSWAASTCRTAADAPRCIMLPSTATPRYGFLSMAGSSRPAAKHKVVLQLLFPLSDGEPPAQ